MRPSPAIFIGLASAVALTLGACSGEYGSSAETTASGAAGEAAGDIALADVEHPQPGLWEQQMSDGAGAAFTFKTCVGAPEAGDNPFTAGPAGGGEQGEDEDCSVRELRRAADGLHFRSVCAMGEGGTLTSTGKVTGDLRRAYRVEVDVKATGIPVEPGMPTESRIVIEARRLGDCPAGVEPGDMVP